MASSSSAKKVARVAAKSGSGSPVGAASVKQRNWLFAVAIVAIVALGVGIVFFARDRNIGLGKNDTKPRANLEDGSPFDHWHAAFAVEVCGKELAPVPQVDPDVEGIHTHGDGLIHIHPFVQTVSGKRATIGKFWQQTGLKVTDDGFRLPSGMAIAGGSDSSGSTIEEGVTTCGGKPGEVVLAHWRDARTAGNKQPDKIYRSNFGAVRFTEDLGAFTLAFVPKGSTDVKAPSSAANIDQLGQADAGGGSAPSTGNSTPVTVPTGAGGSGSSGTGG